MFLPINPWTSYKKEDMPTIDYSFRSDKEYFKHQTIVLSLCSLALIVALVSSVIAAVAKLALDTVGVPENITLKFA